METVAERQHGVLSAYGRSGAQTVRGHVHPLLISRGAAALCERLTREWVEADLGVGGG